MGRYCKPQVLAELSGIKPQTSYEVNPTKGIQLDGIPLPPKGTTRKGKQFWEATVPALFAMGMLSTTDLAELEALLFSYEELQESISKLRAFDKEHKGDLTEATARARGYMHRQYTASQANFNTLSARFGLTPVDRTRLPIIGQEDDKGKDPLAQLLGE